MTPRDIGIAIRDRRKAIHLTQAELAELAECSTPFIVWIEQGKESVRLNKLIQVANVLGLEIKIGALESR